MRNERVYRLFYTSLPAHWKSTSSFLYVFTQYPHSYGTSCMRFYVVSAELSDILYAGLRGICITVGHLVCWILLPQVCMEILYHWCHHCMAKPLFPGLGACEFFLHASLQIIVDMPQHFIETTVLICRSMCLRQKGSEPFSRLPRRMRTASVELCLVIRYMFAEIIYT